MSPEISKQIDDFHTLSWRGIIKIVKHRNTFGKKCYVACYVLSFVFTIYIGFNYNHLINVITALVKANLSIFPCLCGFSISGLAITIGFADKDIIKKSVSIRDYNIYQNGIAIMAMNVILQVICLGISYLISFMCSAGLNDIIFISSGLSKITNLFMVLILTTLTSVSVTMVFFVVFNLFTFGQLNSFYNTFQAFKSPDKDQ